MIWNLEPAWLLMAVASIAVLGLFLGAALDAVMRDDAFGPIGNMVLFTAGFFGAIYLANRYGISLRDINRAAVTGVAGAFLLIGILAAGKACLTRMAR